MDINAMCAKYWPGANIKHFTKEDKSGEVGWVSLLDGWAYFEGPDTPPTTADLIAKEAEYDAWLPGAQTVFEKTKIEDQLRSDPKLKAEVALQAQTQGKSVDEIIAETVAKA